MFVMIDTNENTERNKKENKERTKKGETLVDFSNRRVVQRLRQRFPKIQEVPLDCGDIKVIMDNSQSLAIERKRAGDFLGSISEGHIFSQVERMWNGADWSAVVVEGMITFDRDDMTVIQTFDEQDQLSGTETTGWHGTSVRGAIWAIIMSGTPVITIQPSQLPDIVEDLIRFCMKPADHILRMGKHRRVTFTPITLAEENLAQLAGGLKRARSLLEFAKSNNDNEVATLAEALCWGSALKLIDRKSRPEGWGDKTIENFNARLGLQTGEFLEIQEDKQQTQKKGRKNGEPF